MAKRPLEAVEMDSTPTGTPKKLRFADTTTPTKPQQDTPSKRGRKPKAATNGIGSSQPSPRGPKTPQSARGRGKSALKTPTKQIQSQMEKELAMQSNADRSALRKVNRSLLLRSIEGNNSDDEEEDILANQIWDEDEDHDTVDSDTEWDEHNTADAPDTPSKKSRGRPKGSKTRRTPTPPPNLPPHERYFFHTRPSAAKSSSNTVSSQSLLSHADYHELTTNYQDPHAQHMEALHELHAASYPLWALELAQNYTVCLYGYGSKRRLLTSFADYIHAHPTSSKAPLTLIIHGHHPSCSMRNILQTILQALNLNAAVSSTPATLFASIIAHQKSSRDPTPIYLLISTINARSLTSGSAPSMLAALAVQPSIHLLVTASNPGFPLLWPSSMRDTLNILFHDASTFLSYDDPSISVSELGVGVVDSVAELMGKKGSTAAGRERVQWVLKSLPENARGLYRILVGEILATEADGLPDDGFGGDEDDMETGGYGVGDSGDMPGVDAKVLYQKAAEEFLCSSEMAFRGLLREFLDHAMVVVRREGGGGGAGEILGIDMSKEELEGVLEDLVM
jgi:origin recognition complex subunit 2